MLQQDKDYVLSMGAVFLEENIFYIPNFFNKDLILKIEKEINEETKWTFDDHGKNFADSFIIKNPETLEEIDRIYDRFSKWPSFGENFSNVKDFVFHNVKWVRRRGPGSRELGMGAHWDGDPSPKYINPKTNGAIRVPNRTKWGCVIYLNDNFNGGELFYNDLDIRFKPVTGTLICHATDNARYKHSVFDADAPRYNLIMNFMYGEINEPENGETYYSFNKEIESKKI
jgi:hypothetical protein